MVMLMGRPILQQQQQHWDSTAKSDVIPKSSAAATSKAVLPNLSTAA
jgi:hypothetical protein